MHCDIGLLSLVLVLVTAKLGGNAFYLHSKLHLAYFCEDFNIAEISSSTILGEDAGDNSSPQHRPGPGPLLPPVSKEGNCVFFVL